MHAFGASIGLAKSAPLFREQYGERLVRANEKLSRQRAEKLARLRGIKASDTSSSSASSSSSFGVAGGFRKVLDASMDRLTQMLGLQGK